MYTPHEVAVALRNQELEREDVDLFIDLEHAVGELTEPSRSVLQAYQKGIAPEEALHLKGLFNLNPNRVYTQAIRALTSVLNGISVSVKSERS